MDSIYIARTTSSCGTQSSTDLRSGKNFILVRCFKPVLDTMSGSSQCDAAYSQISCRSAGKACDVDILF